MSKYGRIEILVGIFVLAGILSLALLAFKVSGLTSLYDSSEGYYITAKFTEIGGLKKRARVSIAGVPVGRVVGMTLDKNTFQAIVDMRIENQYNNIPTDTIASIATSGLIGENYVMLEPGGEDEVLKSGSRIEHTDPAIVLERLIGQFLYRMGNDKK
jgi:phospholipid/cholesterol/gamma-HCH transport system substrate-binding protein